MSWHKRWHDREITCRAPKPCNPRGFGLRRMSMTPFGKWLAEIGFGKYEDVFAANKIDFDIIHQMTDADLRELDLALGDRKRLLQAIARLNRQSATEVVTSASVPAKAGAESLSGAAVSHTAERRPLSVMFCDLIGSTALSTRLDPEDLREVIRSYQTCVASTIQRFNGFIARYVGDGVLIYFGWPQAHETDAERAVRAGLAVAAAVGEADVGR